MSSGAISAQGSKVYISGTAATPEVLTAITVGYPTILAITGHAGVANGDLITLTGFTGANAATLNGQTAVVKNYATGATNDTFAIDINTVGLTITIDGSNSTATPTAWIQVKEIKDFKPSGAAVSKIDVTNLDSTAKEYVGGLIDNNDFSMSLNYVTDDSGQAACKAAFEASTTKSWKIVAPNADTFTFSGFLTKFPTIPSGAVDGVLMGDMTVQITGSVTLS